MENNKYICEIPSRVGVLTVESCGGAVTGLWIEGQRYFPENLKDIPLIPSLEIFDKVRHWMKIYFSGREPDFAIPVKPEGTSYRRLVWEQLCEIPFGQTVTYGELAGKINIETGGQTSARAVGGAIAHNPISILIPCHRVVGSDGGMTGYAGGIDTKIKLLELEKAL